MSPYIDPYFISTHFSSYTTYGIENEYVEYNAEYLKKYAPIGCRDLHTKKVLDTYGIDNYVSGCVTLTLDKFKIKKSKEEYICLVDIDEKAEKYIEEKSDVKVIKCTHTLDKEENSNLTYEKRFENVEDLLKKYQNAKLVITSRLHCALPCLALGTPVILVKNKKSAYYNDRIESFLPYLNYFTVDEFIKKDFDELLKIKNKTNFIPMRNQIIEDINNNISKEITNNTNLPDPKAYQAIYVDRKDKINKLLKVMSDNYINLYNENYNNKCKAEYWEKQYNNLMKDKELAVKQNDDYWEKEFSELLEKYNNLLKNEQEND